jgi:phospholipid/cholesterol/gamma-HCH transport system substrate-binding protein
MKRSATFINLCIVVGFAVICVGIMEFLAINIGQPVPFGSAYTIHGVFANADGIPTAADVRVSGIDVGKVTEITHDPRYPAETVVTIQINDIAAVPIFTNGYAKVKPKTLLGEKFIDLTVGNASTGEAIADGGFLPPAQAGKDVSNDEIFNSFDSATRDQQRQVLQALDVATQQRSGSIQNILPQLQSVLANLDPVAHLYERDQPQVDQIFLNLNTIMKALADEHVQLADVFRNGNIALGAVAQKNQALVTTLQEASSFATEFNNVMVSTVTQQRQSIDELAGTLQAQNALLDVVEGNHCFNNTRPCGIDTVFTGTLLGNINYPNDQLTVSSPAGELVTDEWDSMFSQPTNDNRALNLVIAFHCDAITTTLQGALPSLYNQLQQLLSTVQKTICPH